MASANGALLHYTGARVDTLAFDPAWGSAHIRCLAVDRSDAIWLGTQDGGVVRWMNGKRQRLGLGDGLPDAHVNDLSPLPDGRMAVATDQGIAICSERGVEQKLGEAEGAPDNLVLSLHADAEGNIWAGTDRSGVFRWRPRSRLRPVEVLFPDWSFGPVLRLRAYRGAVWAGTQSHGMVLLDRTTDQGLYRADRSEGLVEDVMLDATGTAWWCDGSDALHRSDASVVVVPEHEGHDLRGITALCADSAGSIWFATGEGLFRHSTSFAEGQRLQRSRLRIDRRWPVVSLAVGGDGTVWAATFGQGAWAVRPDGSIEHFTRKQGLPNDNVLAVRTSGARVYFATLEGLGELDHGRITVRAADAGFLFDALPWPGGPPGARERVVLATDGKGVLVSDGPGARAAWLDRGTYYALASDASGKPWAVGPGTGFCAVDGSRERCIGANRSPFDGDLYALGRAAGRLIAFSSTGAAALEPATGSVSDVTAQLGLAGARAELNACCTDYTGTFWLATDRGLHRYRLDERHFTRSQATRIDAIEIDGRLRPAAARVEVDHDENDVSFRFASFHYDDPGAIRFEYHLKGLSERTVLTRDREASFAHLRPGRYTFQVRALLEDEALPGPWSEVELVVLQPWWSTTWARAGFLVGGLVLLILLLHARDRRVHQRQRLEQERVRFQLQALRSQVDPHFLFNSFNALVELIESDPDKAVGHVDQLSTFFRNILQVRDRDLVPLSEELRLLSNYFALEQRRFGPAIVLDTRIDEGLMSHAIVPLALQLLVENALKHNVVVGGEPFIIAIRSEGQALVVSNPIRPRATPSPSTGFGLDSIVQRYQVLSPRPIVIIRGASEFVVQIPLLEPEP
jgi:ligand-binding sensor domain-containing protein